MNPHLVDRRRLIAGVGAAGLLPAAANANSAYALSPAALALCLDIRRRLHEVRRLVSFELSIEGEPEHAMAERVAVAAEHAFEGFCTDLLTRPIESWDGVVIRAEVARAVAQFTREGIPSSCCPQEGNDKDVEALGYLLSAVVQMGGVGRLELDV